MLIVKKVLIALCTAMISSICYAAPINIANSGFESQVLANGDFVQNIVTDWTVSSNAGPFNPTSVHLPLQAPEGQNILFINTGNVSQVLTTNLQAETFYSLVVDVCDRTDHPMPAYLVELIAGSTTLVSDINTLVPLSGCLTSIINYTSTTADSELGNALQIRLSKTGTGQVNFDNVRLNGVSITTTLGLGDVAITGLNSDNPDTFTFILFKDIKVGTTLTYTDNGWMEFGGFRIGEGVETWTAGENMRRGTQITISSTNITNDGGYLDSGSITTIIAGFSLSTEGDSIIMYQGLQPTNNTDTNFVTAFNYNINLILWNPLTGWSTHSTSATDSSLPPVFTRYVNAIDFSGGFGGMPSEIEMDNFSLDPNNCILNLLDKTQFFMPINWVKNDFIPLMQPTCPFIDAEVLFINGFE